MLKISLKVLIFFLAPMLPIYSLSLGGKIGKYIYVHRGAYTHHQGASFFYAIEIFFYAAGCFLALKIMMTFLVTTGQEHLCQKVEEVSIFWFMFFAVMILSLLPFSPWYAVLALVVYYVGVSISLYRVFPFEDTLLPDDICLN